MYTAIETKRLSFRKLTSTDIKDLCEMLQDPDVTAAWEHTFTDAQVQQWLDRQLERYENDGIGVLAMIEKETKALAGQGGLIWGEIHDVRVLELSYMLKKSQWHKGFAVEGAAGLAQYAFEEIGVDKVNLPIRPENNASRRVAEKLGAKIEGDYVKNYNNKDMLHLVYVLDKASE